MLFSYNSFNSFSLLEELTTSPLKEINVQTPSGDDLLSIEEILGEIGGGDMSLVSAGKYLATQGTPNRLFLKTFIII